MTTDHTELCLGLRLMGSPRAVRAADSIEQQAARIAELQRELETARQERNAAAVKARRELMPAYEARIAELEKERDALKADAERYDFLRCRAELRDYCMGLYWHIKTVDVPMGMPLIDATLANVIDAAIQDEKETRS